MTPPAKEALAIYWDGEEVSGFTIYGLRPRNKLHVSNLPPLPQEWDAQTRASVLHGARWEVCVWDVRVGTWPESVDFTSTIRSLFRDIVDHGFVVAWIGLEGYFADPPLLFAPEAMSGGVVAAYSKRTGLLSKLNLDVPLCALPNSDLVALREASGDLALAEEPTGTDRGTMQP